MIRQKDIEKCKFFTISGGDIWKVKKNRIVTELELENCETGKLETCRVGEQSSERFVAIAMPAVGGETKSKRRGRPRIKRIEDSPQNALRQGRKTEDGGQKNASQSSKGKRRGRPPKVRDERRGTKDVKTELRTLVRGKKKGKEQSSQYLGVTVQQSKEGPRYLAQSSRGGKWKGLGVHNVEELAAAAVQEHIGNHAEAKRLRVLAQQKTDTAIDELKGNTGQMRFLCSGCGADYEQKPGQCKKCGGSSFEQIQPEAKRK